MGLVEDIYAGILFALFRQLMCLEDFGCLGALKHELIRHKFAIEEARYIYMDPLLQEYLLGGQVGRGYLHVLKNM